MAHPAPSIDKPRFRHEHLVAEAIEDRGNRFIDVMDPDSGSMFRFYEIEFSLACAMDGQRDVAGIVQWAKEELGLTPSTNEVRTVIATLGELGYLDETAASKAAANAMPARNAGGDDELAAGVVVAAQQRAPMPPAADIELGRAGTLAPRAEAIGEMPKPADLALGASGTSAAPAPPRAPVEDVPLGAPGRSFQEEPTQVSDVSLDLSSHMGIVDTADVKEAVRASKVMTAVDVPPELQEQLDAPKPARVEAPRPAEPTPRPVEPRSVEPPRPVARAETPAPVAKEAPKKPTSKQLEKAPEKQPVQKTAPTQPGRRMSPVLVVLLILVIGAAGAYVVWKYVLTKSNDQASKTGDVKQPVATQPTQPPQPTEPVKQPDPAIKLAVDTPAVADVKAVAAGTVEEIKDAGPVKQGDVIVMLAGYKPVATEIAYFMKEVERVRREVTKGEEDLAKAAGNADKTRRAEAFLAERKKSLAEKEANRDRKQAELDKLVIKAPVAGELKPIATKKQKVAADAPLFSITPSPVLVATFKPDAAKADTNVYVAVKGNEQKLTCRVTAVDATGTKVACPHDASLEGSEVTLAGAAPDGETQTEDPAVEQTNDEPKNAEPKKAEPKKEPPRRPPAPKKDPAPEKPAEPPPAADKPADPPANP